MARKLNRKGQSMVEYALLLLVLVVCIPAIRILGQSINWKIQYSADLMIATAAPLNPPAEMDPDCGGGCNGN